jgi:hypothetical protein
MKNYILGIVAIVMAIGFSAFNVQKPVPKTTDTFWYYRVDASTDAILSSSSLVNTNAAQTRADFESDHASETCSGNGQDCLRGFIDPIPAGDFPYTLDGQDAFQKQ